MPIHDWTRVEAGIFHDFHHEWISTIKRELNSGVLPPGYYALAEQIAGGRGPDVLTLENPDSYVGELDDSSSDDGVIGLATAPPKVRFTASSETEQYARKRNRIAIRHRSDDNVVAMIEIVSPGNKSSRHAIKSFVEKAVELLDAGIHLLIIDVFPPGPRDPQGIHGVLWSMFVEDDFQLPPDQPLTLAAYSAGDVNQAFIEPVAVGGQLPEMPLFLKVHHYVHVPLESAYQNAFDAVPQRWRDQL